MKNKVLIVLLALTILTGCGCSTKKKEYKSNKNSNNSSNESYDYDDSDEESGYTNDELISMAKKYYENKTGRTDEIVEIDHTVGNDISIRIYYIRDNRKITLDWYNINRKDGRGKNSSNESINISEN